MPAPPEVEQEMKNVAAEDCAGVAAAGAAAAVATAKPFHLVSMASILLAAHCFCSISMLFASRAGASESPSQRPPSSNGRLSVTTLYACLSYARKAPDIGTLEAEGNRA